MLAQLRAKKERWLSRRLLRQFVAPGCLCFDVGANIGDISEIMLKLGARVVAIEPQAENALRLQQRFESHRAITIVPMAAGANQGAAELLICTSSDCSSLSPEFAETLSRSGRVPASYLWDHTEKVEITTLDALISRFGTPHFVKIDVEGYEAEVLKGLNSPVRTLSFEFTPERLDPALECIRRLSSLGDYEFNFTIGRRHRLELEPWVGPDKLADELSTRTFPMIGGPGGDAYARLRQRSGQ